jgi:UDP-glucose 4-epimerase
MKNLYVCGNGFVGGAVHRNKQVFKNSKIRLQKSSRDFIYAYNQIDFRSLRSELIHKNIDVVLNASGPTNIQASFSNLDLYLNQPLMQVKSHLQLLSEVKKEITYLYLSSASVYGNTPIEAKESQQLFPESPYAVGKAVVETFLLNAESIPENVTVKILRATSLYDITLSSRVLFLIKESLLKTKSINLFGSGDETRDFLHTTDLSRFIAQIVIQDSKMAEVFNLGSGCSLTMREVVDIARRILLDVEVESTAIFSGIERIGDPVNMKVSVEKLCSLGTSTTIFPTKGLGNYFEAE